MLIPKGALSRKENKTQCYSYHTPVTLVSTFFCSGMVQLCQVGLHSTGLSTKIQDHRWIESLSADGSVSHHSLPEIPQLLNTRFQLILPLAYS